MISLIEHLTGKRWNFGDPPALSSFGDTQGVATFSNLDVGLYTIINDGVGDVEVVLWGVTYTVASNSRWHFMAHPEVRSISPLAAPIAAPTYSGPPITIEPTIPDPFATT